MLYLWVKAVHLMAVITFVAGLVTMAVGGRLAQPEWRRAVRRADYALASPALAVVWITGPVLAVMANAWHAPWLMAKLVFVLVISALHGRLSATLRRLERDGSRPPPAWFRYAAPATLMSMVAIVALVIVKPF
ncbi:CopD family protein [Pandoraea anhela]|uniref:Protoporphyrinogen IX oxidase n=1 Tax=Pandoraea anhela TaxID=2508295 RepID=A0A5E4XFG0_9BURK|nr:CopD family protein [Pandoraea anhela]VVE34952.1 membrane protein [Pandoraea anhela]